jgi:hypothetical protein
MPTRYVLVPPPVMGEALGATSLRTSGDSLTSAGILGHLRSGAAAIAADV